MASSAFSDPIWSRPPRLGASHTPIASGEVVDVAIVGAGFQGLSTALAAACKGLSVRVIEARQIGEGASGLNGGQVIPGLKYDPEWLIAHFGEEAGARLVDFAAGTADRLFTLIEREGLDVPRLRNGWISASTTETAFDAARERDRQWQARGADVKLLDAKEIAAMTGARGYVGGWLDRRAGVVDPLSLVCELGRVAQAAGARIALDTPVASVKKSNGIWRITTAAGDEVKARFVVLATNAYSDDLIPGLARSLVPLHSFQIATEPFPEEVFDHILPGGQAVSDSRRILVYYRRGPNGGLVLGGRGSMAIPKSDSDWQHLERAMLRLYPGLKCVATVKRWFGRVGMTPDHLPHIHEPEPGLLAIVGCQGRGVAMMTAIGERFANYMMSGDPTTLPVPITPIRPIPFHAFRQVGVAATIVWYRTLDAMAR